MTVGSPGLVAQSVQTAALVTLHPLVSDGARYAVMAAQLSHRKIIAPPVFDKAKALFPHIALFPGHRLPVCPKVFTMCPVHFVQYVPGIYRRRCTQKCVRHGWVICRRVGALRHAVRLRLCRWGRLGEHLGVARGRGLWWGIGLRLSNS